MVDWDQVIEEHGPMVVGISWRILGHEADVEDNVQDVFLHAYRLHSTHQVRHWRGLLRRLATFGALARLRRRRTDVSLESDPPEHTATSAEQYALRRELEDQLRDAMTRLPEREGAVFSLHYFEGLSLREIAESLSISYSAAGAALSRARAKLERALCDVPVERTNGSTNA